MADARTQDGVPLAYLTPMRAARGPWRAIGLGQSFAVHLLGLFILLVGLIAMGETEFVDIMRALADEPLIVSLTLAGMVMSLEALYLLAALLSTCLGGGCESWDDGIKRTLSRWYQLTPWHAMLALMLIGATLLINDLEQQYYDSYYKLGEQRVLERERIAFLLNAGQIGAVTLFFALNLWMTLTTLAVHRDRPTWYANCRWPAQCEGCGYALLGLDDDQGCPECGRPIRESTHSQRGPIRGGYWAIAHAALTRPSQLGAQMAVRRPMQRHYRILIIALFMLVLFGPISVGMAELSEAASGYTYGGSALDYLMRYVFGGLLAGVLMAGFGAAVCIATGSLHALFARLLSKRHALPAACQACCLSAGLLPFWALAGMLSLLVVRHVGEWMYMRGGSGYEALLPIAWLLLHGFLFVLYFVVVGRICRAARFANV